MLKGGIIPLFGKEGGGEIYKQADLGMGERRETISGDCRVAALLAMTVWPGGSV
jgi:hypothetical protein